MSEPSSFEGQGSSPFNGTNFFLKVNKGQRSWSSTDSGRRWRPTVVVAGGRRRESDGGGRRRAVAANDGGGRWPAAGVRRWWPTAEVRRWWAAAEVRQWWPAAGFWQWWPAARYDWLDMYMWHSMLALEGVALCVILICFNDIFVKLGTTIWFFALC